MTVNLSFHVNYTYMIIDNDSVKWYNKQRFEMEVQSMICKNCGKKVYAKEVCDCGEKAPNPHSRGVAFNSIICTIVLVFSVIAIITTVSLRRIVNENLLVQTVEQTDFCSLEVKDDGKKIKLDQYIYDEFVADERITVQNVDNILNAPFIKNFIIDKIEGYQDFFMDRGDMEYITSDDIVKLIDDNSKLLFDEAGLEFLGPDKEELKNNLSVLDDLSKFCNDYLTGWFTSALVQTNFSLLYVNFLEILFVVVLVQWLVVYRLNGRRMSKALEKYSIAVMIPSGILFVASMLLYIPDKNSILGAFTMYLRSTFIITSAIVLGAGIILNIISTLTGPKKVKKGTVKISAYDTAAEVTESEKPIENDNTDVVPDISFAPSEKTDENNDKTEADLSEQKTSEEAKSVFCTQCGHKNRENSAFCSKCGTKLRK